MFRFLSKLPSFFQRARALAVAAIKVVNVFIQVCDFAIGVSQQEIESSATLSTAS